MAALVLIGLSAMLFAPVKLVPRAQQKSGTAAAKAVQVVPLSSSGDANGNASDNASGNATTGAVIASASTPAPKPMLQGNANGDSVTMAVLPQATAVSATAVSARRPFRKMRNFQLMIVSLVMLGFGYMVRVCRALHCCRHTAHAEFLCHVLAGAFRALGTDEKCVCDSTPVLWHLTLRSPR